MKILKEYFFPRLILDFATFFPALIILGIVSTKAVLNFEVLLAIFTNYILVVISFVYNDLKDMEDDKLSKFKALPVLVHLNILHKKSDGFKRFNNMFSAEMISKNTGILLIIFLSIISILLSYIVGGIPAIIVAILMLILGFVYSGVGRIRVKSVPFLDMPVHALLLATLPVFYFFTINNAIITLESYIILIGVTVFSLGSSLDNQARDYEDDMKAKIKNTASLIGRKNTEILSIVFRVLGSLMVLISIGLIYIEF